MDKTLKLILYILARSDQLNQVSVGNSAVNMASMKSPVSLLWQYRCVPCARAVGACQAAPSNLSNASRAVEVIMALT